MQSLGTYGDVGPPVIDYSITDLVAISGGMGRAVSPPADAVAGGTGRAVSPPADAFEEPMEGTASPRKNAMTEKMGGHSFHSGWWEWDGRSRWSKAL